METGFKPFYQGRPPVDGATLIQKTTRAKLPVLQWIAHRECSGPLYVESPYNGGHVFRSVCVGNLRPQITSLPGGSMC